MCLFNIPHILFLAFLSLFHIFGASSQTQCIHYFNCFVNFTFFTSLIFVREQTSGGDATEYKLILKMCWFIWFLKGLLVKPYQNKFDIDFFINLPPCLTTSSHTQGYQYTLTISPWCPDLPVVTSPWHHGLLPSSGGSGTLQEVLQRDRQVVDPKWATWKSRQWVKFQL